MYEVKSTENWCLGDFEPRLVDVEWPFAHGNVEWIYA